MGVREDGQALGERRRTREYGNGLGLTCWANGWSSGRDS